MGKKTSKQTRCHHCSWARVSSETVKRRSSIYRKCVLGGGKVGQSQSEGGVQTASVCLPDRLHLCSQILKEGHRKYWCAVVTDNEKGCAVMSTFNKATSTFLVSLGSVLACAWISTAEQVHFQVVFLVTVWVTVVPATLNYNRPKEQQINRLKSQPMLRFASREYYWNILKWLWDDCCHWTSHQAQCWKVYMMWWFCILGILKYKKFLFKRCSFLICISWQWFWLCLPSTEANLTTSRQPSVYQYNLFLSHSKKLDLDILTIWGQT